MPMYLRKKIVELAWSEDLKIWVFMDQLSKIQTPTVGQNPIRRSPDNRCSTTVNVKESTKKRLKLEAYKAGVYMWVYVESLLKDYTKNDILD